MLSITFAKEELQLLVEVLDRTIPPLREDIVQATEDHDYRDAFRERERLLNVILEKLRDKLTPSPSLALS